jgi:hypothetical protein
MTRFLRTRLGRASRPVADLVQTVPGPPPPDVLRRAAEGVGVEPAADVVAVAEVQDRHPLPGETSDRG